MPYWLLCKKKCGHCQTNGKFTNVIPLHVSRDELLDDIHGQNRTNISSSWHCAGLHRFFNRLQSSLVLNTENITDFSYMFQSCTGTNGNYESISQWDVSHGNTFDCMFQDSNINVDLKKWDVSSALTMKNMFSNSLFTGDIRQWDFSSLIVNAQDFTAMFDADVSRRNQKYENLHMLDFMPTANMKFANTTGTSSVKVSQPPCWYVQNNDSNAVNLQNCSTGPNQACSYNPTSISCTAKYINNLHLDCSETSLAIIDTLCPYLKQQPFSSATCGVGSNCAYNCNYDVYADTCQIDFDDNNTDIHAELTCSQHHYVILNNRMEMASQHCKSSCILKQFPFSEGIAMCDARTDCIALQVYGKCPTTVEDNGNVTMCTELTAINDSLSDSLSTTCVASFADVNNFKKQLENTTTSTSTRTSTSTSTSTSTTTATTQIIKEFDFDLLPTIKSKGPIVTISILFVVVLGTHLFLLIKG